MSDETKLHCCPPLDAMLTTEQCAAWLQMTPETLAEKSPKLNPEIPAFRIGPKIKLFHPRTIITHLAKKAGVPMEQIAASFGLHLNKPQQP